MRVGGGRINQCGRETEGALLHRAVEDLLLALQFLRRGRTVLHAEDLLADRRDRRERPEVDRRPAILQRVQVAVESGPVVLQVISVESHPVGRVAGPQRRRAAFANDFRRDALADVALAVGVHEERDARLPLHVDESRRHDVAGGVDCPPRATGRRADRDDAVAPDRDVGAAGRSSGPVDEVAVLDHEVELRRAGGGRKQRDADNGRESEMHAEFSAIDSRRSVGAAAPR